jgi:tetratricopeptide (TPR) repeat protein
LRVAEGTTQLQLSAGAAVVRNPLSVIALFVLLVEAIATVTLIQVRDQREVALPLVWFVVLFPTMIALLFFSTLWWRHQFLYAPTEYRSDESFLTAMHRLQRVEARQEAAELNPRTTDEQESLQVVDRLLALGDVRAAVKVGRTFLEANNFDVAERIFQHILDQSPKGHEARYNALANLGYAQIGLKKYPEAVDQLEASIKLVRRPWPWHYLALAYAHFKLSAEAGDKHEVQSRKYLDLGKAHPSFRESRDFYKKLYPDMAAQLSIRK